MNCWVGWFSVSSSFTNPGERKCKGSHGTGETFPDRVSGKERESGMHRDLSHPAVKAKIEKQAEGVSGRCPREGVRVASEPGEGAQPRSSSGHASRTCETRSHLPDDRDEKGTTSVSEDVENLGPTQSPGGL